MEITVVFYDEFGNELKLSDLSNEHLSNLIKACENQIVQNNNIQKCINGFSKVKEVNDLLKEMGA